MPGLYSHTTRSSGTTLTASIYNSDHQSHIDNHIPSQMDDYSSDVPEMKATTDPGEDGSESRATSLAGELERLRFIIAEITGKTQWYETPASDLSQVVANAIAAGTSGVSFPNVNADVTATDEELNNADESATSGGGFMKGPTSSTDPGLALDTWRTPNSNRPTLVTVAAEIQGGNGSTAQVTILVDESGGTTNDYTGGTVGDLVIAHVDEDDNANTENIGSVSFLVPAGGSYQIENTSDPNTANAITIHREWTL